MTDTLEIWVQLAKILMYICFQKNQGRLANCIVKFNGKTPNYHLNLQTQVCMDEHWLGLK